MDRGENGGQGCPNCRVALHSKNIVPDLRSDRKSAEQPRSCAFHGNGCVYVGTRQETVAHEQQCVCDPDRCTSQLCKDEITQLQAENAKFQAQIVQLTRAVATTNRAAALSVQASVKLALTSAAFLRAETILMNAYGFDGAKVYCTDVFTTDNFDSKKYVIEARTSPNCRSHKDFDMHITEANCSMSVFCFLPKYYTVSDKVFPKLNIVLTLVSPDPAKEDWQLTFKLEQDPEFPLTSSVGKRWWMSDDRFAEYVRDGKFAVGWNVSILQ